MQRNEYVLKSMFGSFFLATVMTALIAQSRTPFRLMCLALLPKAIAETLSMLYFVQGHQTLCRWIIITVRQLLQFVQTFITVGETGF